MGTPFNIKLVEYQSSRMKDGGGGGLASTKETISVALYPASSKSIYKDVIGVTFVTLPLW